MKQRKKVIIPFLLITIVIIITVTFFFLKLPVSNNIGSVGYWKNFSGVYWGTCNIGFVLFPCFYPDKFEKIEGADPFSFKVLRDELYMYGIDKKNVYFNEKRIEGADVHSFELTNYKGDSAQKYTKDANSVYLKGQRILLGDPSTFELMDNLLELARDKDNVFLGNDNIPGADPETFEDRYDYFIDKNNIYFGKSVVPNSDPNTFKQVGSTCGYSCYNVDKNQAYFGFKIINGANPAEIKSVYLLSPLKNKELSYCCTNYAKTESDVYYKELLIEKADPGSFSIVDDSEWQTTKTAEFWYSKDKNYVYFQGKIIDNADPQTFQITSSKSAQDKNYKYQIMPPYNFPTTAD